MCVIIARKPEAEIPFDNLKSACLGNRDGWGVSVADRGKLTTRHEYKTAGNDPEDIALFLEETKGLPTMVHLRLATSGMKSEANCHPFKVLTKPTHGVDLSFAHNGVLHDFADSKSSLSDTWHFNNEILTPLVLRCALYSEDILKDPLLASILKQYAGHNSIFSLMDGDGNYLIVNRGRGKDFDFGWASNPGALTIKTSTNSTYSSRYGSSQFLPLPPEDKKVVSIKPPSTTGIDDFRKRLSEADKTKPIYIPDFTKRESFTSLMGLTTLDDLQYFSTDDLLEMAKKHPRLAALAILDLMADRLSEYKE